MKKITMNACRGLVCLSLACSMHDCGDKISQEENQKNAHQATRQPEADVTPKKVVMKVENAGRIFKLTFVNNTSQAVSTKDYSIRARMTAAKNLHNEDVALTSRNEASDEQIQKIYYQYTNPSGSITRTGICITNNNAQPVPIHGLLDYDASLLEVHESLEAELGISSSDSNIANATIQCELIDAQGAIIDEKKLVYSADRTLTSIEAHTIKLKAHQASVVSDQATRQGTLQSIVLIQNLAPQVIDLAGITLKCSFTVKDNLNFEGSATISSSPTYLVEQDIYCIPIAISLNTTQVNQIQSCLADNFNVTLTAVSKDGVALASVMRNGLTSRGTFFINDNFDF